MSQRQKAPEREAQRGFLAALSDLLKDPHCESFSNYRIRDLRFIPG